MMPTIAGLALSANAQNIHDYSFKRDTSISCLRSDGSAFAFGFAGGMNSCQYGAIDLNGDGLKDLVVFDRTGNRLLPFLKTSTGLSGYVYAPYYSRFFPAMEHWMQLVDYNNDGREDIFTYTTGGIKVFRNSSSGVPHFTQMTHPYITWQNGSSFTNILVTYADYPAICDLDGDGDLDILTFAVLGTFVDHYNNISIEKYGNPDSLAFKQTESCWGRFAEGEDSDQILLDTCSKGGKSGFVGQAFPEDGSDPKHTGSTLLALGLDSDKDKALILGDVDYPTLKALWNGGDIVLASITSVDQAFPTGLQPVDLVSFPAACQLDVNDDGLKDLIVSPFDPSLTKGKSDHSSWLYLNTGTEASPVFTLNSKDFLQSEMLDFGSGAYPLASDVDGDGLTDLLVGNYGYLDSSYYESGHLLRTIYHSRLAYLRNTGTTSNPSFKLITDDYANLSALKILAAYPATGDLDGDGDNDLLVGNADGTFIYLENLAGPGHVPEYALPVFHYMNLDAGDFSAPQLVDLDQDGLLDIVSGNRNGQLSFYKNTGTIHHPAFLLITDFLGNIDITDPQLSVYGYSTPCFFKGSDAKWRLMLGAELGGIHYYKNITDNLGGSFLKVESDVQGNNDGLRTGVAVLQADGDAYPDMVIGNYAGGLSFYRGITPQPIGINEPEIKPGIQVSLYPNPASDKVYINIGQELKSGHLEIHIFGIDGKLCYNSGLQPLVNNFALPVSGITPGIYICKISITTSAGEPVIVAYRKLIVNR
ncbi:MAG TPA: T9SS type A sorting domain-containing protein [Bacteroidales bacterium]